MRFLIAEDNEALGTFLKRGLEADGHEVRVASDGQAAVDSFLEQTPEMAVLDLNMPRLDGTEVLRFFRTVTGDLPILVLSARNDVATRIACFDLGADDCMMKPFSLAELRARCRALARRRRDDSLVLRHGPLEMDRVGRSVVCDGQAVELTGKEFALLEHLLLNRGRSVSRATLLEQVWKTPEAGTNVVDVYVTYLRRKLGREAGALIETVRGEGYAIGLRKRRGGAGDSQSRIATKEDQAIGLRERLGGVDGKLAVNQALVKGEQQTWQQPQH
ncbi:MAG TPA: response regulator transcription factor [Acidobacteriaceae bacterium]|jgi:DNA-binding response OmpR family regulator|nr:response regulator transcription factor [Acidobacteriaceae bacterium]